MSESATSRLGKLGVWCALDALPRERMLDFVRQIEGWGYGTFWSPEAVGRDPFTLIAFLAGQTHKLVFATGIANIYARDAMTMKAIHKTLAELAPQRFVLGLGVSHEHLVTKLRGHEYKPPVAAMRDYLDAMDKALYFGMTPVVEAPIVLAALRKPMLELAKARTSGAHPYLVPPEHTARARAILGPGPWLCPEQMVLRETDPDKARALARKHLKFYTRLPNYQRNLRDFGFGDSDFENIASDRLVDALVAWGDRDTIAARIEAHIAAGADHVCIQAFHPSGSAEPDMELLRALAPAPAIPPANTP